MYDYPALKTPVLSLIVAGFFSILAWKGGFLPDWLRIFFAFLAAVFAGVALVTLANWVAYQFGNRVREINSARNYGLVSAATAVKDLTRRQLEILEEYGTVKMEMIIGELGASLVVRTPAGPRPVDLFQDFIEASWLTWPQLFPIRNHGDFAAMFPDWTDVERELTNATQTLVNAGWAYKRPGQVAIARKEREWVAEQFGMEIENG